jgi:hypothetical protein
VPSHASLAFRGLRALGARAALAAVACSFALTCLAACDEERKQECDKILAAMRPLKEGTPTSAAVDKVKADVAAIQLQDQPLGVYAKNYEKTLSVLSNTLKLKENAPSADAVPDGTEGVIKKNLAEARTDDDDISRYCAP